MDWYYAKSGKQEGPVDEAALRAKIQSGEVGATDLVWREGMAEWLASEKVSELQAPAGGAGAEVGGTPGGPAAVAGPGGGAVQPAPGMPGYVPAPTSGLAIASLVCGIVGIFLCYVHALCALPAVICGHMALKQINKASVPLGGRGMAVAGLVTGYIGLLFQVATIVIIAIAVISEM